MVVLLSGYRFSGVNSCFQHFEPWGQDHLQSCALVSVILGNLCACGERWHSGCDVHPTTMVGNLKEVHIVSLPAGVVEDKSVVSTVQSHSVEGVLPCPNRLSPLIYRFCPVQSRVSLEFCCRNIRYVFGS